MLRGHLDEIAEHVVVADLQDADAGLVGIARLQRRDDAAGFIAQRPCLVERGVVARAHEAAVALEGGQFGRSAASVRPPACRRAARQRRHRVGDVCRRLLERPKRAREIARPPSTPSRIAARSRGPPRPSASRDSARARSGAACSRERSLGARRAVADESLRPHRAAARSRRLGQRRRQPLRQQPRAGRRHGAVDRASSEPRRSPDSVRISSRLARVAWSIAMRRAGAFAQRRRQRRALAELRALDIGDAGRRGGQLQPRQRAERLAGRDREEDRRAAARRSRRRTRRASAASPPAASASRAPDRRRHKARRRR